VTRVLQPSTVPPLVPVSFHYTAVLGSCCIRSVRPLLSFSAHLVRIPGLLDFVFPLLPDFLPRLAQQTG